MLQARVIEEKFSSLYKAGKIVGGVYVGRGQEAFSVAHALYLDRSKGDVYGPVIRDQAGRLAFGESIIDGARTYFGSVRGPMRGRDGNIHRGRPKEGLPAMISHLGSLLPVINGMLMARRFRGETGFVGAVSSGDGGTSTGAFHEGLNQAAVEKLPLVVAVANNQFAYSTPTERQYACENLVDRAAGYGVEGYVCDGTDLSDCLKVFELAVQRARSGKGPQMVVGKLLRLSGHGEHDDARYVPDQLRAEGAGRDCIAVATEKVLSEQLMSEKELSDMRAEIQQEVEAEISKAQNEPPPSPVDEKWRAFSGTSLSSGE